MILWYVFWRLLIVLGLLMLTGVVALITALANHESTPRDRIVRTERMRVLNGCHADSRRQMVKDPPVFPHAEDLESHLNKRPN